MSNVDDPTGVLNIPPDDIDPTWEELPRKGRIKQLPKARKKDHPSTVNVPKELKFMGAPIMRQNPHKTCKECGFKCTSMRSLRHHMEINHSPDKPFACKECGFRFNLESTLKEHMDVIHSVTKLACLICEEFTCTDEEVLKGHIERHSKHNQAGPYSCPNCEFICKDYSALKEHLVTHTNETVYGCTLCDFKTPDVSVLQQHMIVHSEDMSFACSECSYTCKDFGDIKQHMSLHVSQTFPADQRYGCLECSFKCKELFELEDHMKLVHSKSFSCFECDFKCDKEDEMTKHMRKHYTCIKCNHECKGKLELEKHMLTHIEPQRVSQETIFACTECEFRTKVKKAIEVHIQQHAKESIFRCEICNFDTKDKAELENHMSLHGLQIVEITAEGTIIANQLNALQVKSGNNQEVFDSISNFIPQSSNQFTLLDNVTSAGSPLNCNEISQNDTLGKIDGSAVDLHQSKLISSLLRNNNEFVQENTTSVSNPYVVFKEQISNNLDKNEIKEELKSVTKYKRSRKRSESRNDVKFANEKKILESTEKTDETLKMDLHLEPKPKISVSPIKELQQTQDQIHQKKNPRRSAAKRPDPDYLYDDQLDSLLSRSITSCKTLRKTYTQTINSFGQTVFVCLDCNLQNGSKSEIEDHILCSCPGREKPKAKRKKPIAKSLAAGENNFCKLEL